MTRAAILAVLLLAACTAPRAASDDSPRPGQLGAPQEPSPTAVVVELPRQRAIRPTAPHPSPAVVNVTTSEGDPSPTIPMPAVTRYTGTATWYCSEGRHGSPRSACTRGYGPSDLIGAIDRKDTTFRRGDRVTVRYGRKHVTVTIVDTCACADRRVIDLSIAAFERLAPWGLGVLPVTVELAGPGPTLPATDR